MRKLSLKISRAERNKPSGLRLSAIGLAALKIAASLSKNESVAKNESGESNEQGDQEENVDTASNKGIAATDTRNTSL